MGKKLILVGMSLAAMAALALPAVASASPELNDESGSVEVGAAITGTSTNALTTNTALGTLECDHVLISGEVTANSKGVVEGIGTGGDTTTCNAGPAEMTVTEPTLNHIETSAEGENNLSMSFIADVGPFECEFKGGGTFSYETGTGNNDLHISNVVLTTDEVCAAEEGDTIFEGDFALTTEAGGEIWID